MDTNRQIAQLFSEIASLLEIQNANPFKVRAYKNASKLIGELESDISEEAATDARGLIKVKGIGKDMSSKINEFIETGDIHYHKKLRSEVGAGLLEIMKLRGVGPKMVRLFSDDGIGNIDELERRIGNGSLADIEGIGKKKADGILAAVAFYKKNLSLHGLGEALAAARILCDEISSVNGVAGVRQVGCLRRMRETVSEIELLVSRGSGFSDTAFAHFFRTLSNLRHLENIERIDGSSAVANTTFGIKAVIHITCPRDFVFDLVRLTGSKSHWGKLLSIGRHEPGFHPKNEKDFYSGLGLPFIPPELREDCGEIEAAKNGALPQLVDLSDIKGDLHTHTNWSDGTDSVEQMAIAAREMGYEYIAVTDHSPSSAVANGLNVERLELKTKEVEDVNSRLSGIKVLTGAEVDIKPDGSLDYPDHVLAGLDFVVASIHSSFSLDHDLMTARVIRALENPFVHALGHPTARIIGKRPHCGMDMGKVMEVARKLNKALEINSSCQRLDLKDNHVRLAVEKGVKLIMSTDAHSTRQLSGMVCGVGVARRGWAKPQDFLNSLPLGDLLDRLGRCGQK